jgi:hypothetical protein
MSFKIQNPIISQCSASNTVIHKVLSEYYLWSFIRVRNAVNPTFLTPHTFWNIVDSDAKCEKPFHQYLFPEYKGTGYPRSKFYCSLLQIITDSDYYSRTE